MSNSNEDEKILRKIIREALTKSDKAEIERIARKQSQRVFDQKISSAIEKELGKDFFKPSGKISKHVDTCCKVLNIYSKICLTFDKQMLDF